MRVPAVIDLVRLSRRAVVAFAERRRPGYAAAIVAASIESTEQTVTIRRADYDRLRDEFALVCGPGCQLRRLFAWWGIRDDGRCGCSDFAAQMDAWGPDGCAAREDDILGHLAEASVKRGLPFVPPAARMLIRQAIAAARLEATPGTAATGPG